MIGSQISLYQEIKNTGAEIDCHCSDLYAEATPAVLAIVKRRGITPWSSKPFRSDGKVWLDFPFQYMPYWNERGMN